VVQDDFDDEVKWWLKKVDLLILIMRGRWWLIEAVGDE
jgi:hypothetical protein